MSTAFRHPPPPAPDAVARKGVAPGACGDRTADFDNDGTTGSDVLCEREREGEAHVLHTVPTPYLGWEEGKGTTRRAKSLQLPNHPLLRVEPEHHCSAPQRLLQRDGCGREGAADRVCESRHAHSMRREDTVVDRGAFSSRHLFPLLFTHARATTHILEEEGGVVVRLRVPEAAGRDLDALVLGLPEDDLDDELVPREGERCTHTEGEHARVRTERDAADGPQLQ